MSFLKKYYEELYINSETDRDLTPQNQDIITELLDQNGAVGVVGLFDQPGYPIYFISGFTLTALGYNHDEIMQISDGKFLNLIFEKDRQSFTQNIAEEHTAIQEFRMVNRTGKNIWVSSYQQNSYSLDGHPIIILSIHVVDDARKRESELLDALTKGYNRIIYADEKQGRYRVIKSEQSGFDEQVCGTLEELKELLQQYARDYINPEDNSFSEVLKELSFFSNTAERNGTYQATYRAKIGEEYQWVQFQAFYGGVMNLDTGHIILAFRVVDEEKRRELNANRILSDSLARAEEASRVKNKFLSRMSHDMRTPINGIMGMLEIIRKNLSEPEKVEECLDKISLSCDNLISLVNDVLDMNNLENGKTELAEETFDLYTYLPQEFGPVFRKAEENGITCTLKIEPFRHRTVIGSPKHIRQIFDKILDNAIKYNKPNGSIIITGHELSYNDKLAIYEYAVEDTGLGMSEEFIQNIFEPFEQEHNEARTKYMGTGLGMSIVKKLVDQMNGKVAVESTPGKGTRVFITLPFSVSDENFVAEPVLPEPENVDLTGKKILLVEDNEINMEIACFILEEFGMDVICAEDGKRAVELFEQSAPQEISIVLMDIMMPVMDGLEATKTIRRLPRPDAKTVPIIAVSANVTDQDIKKSKMAGMDEHLSKPINADQLQMVIVKCLSAASHNAV